jgi:hypothetical protein
MVHIDSLHRSHHFLHLKRFKSTKNLFDTLKNQKIPCGADIGGLAPQTPQHLFNIVFMQLPCKKLPPLQNALPVPLILSEALIIHLPPRPF